MPACPWKRGHPPRSAAGHMTRLPPVSYAARFDVYCPNMTVTERFTTFRYAYLMAAASFDA